MLHFIGLGSAFNTELGNTSAFIKHQPSMLLIDCGGTVFHRINELKLLNNVKQLYIIITHTHPDHIGSLGEVIFYAYYILKIKPVIYYPNKTILETLFSCIGVEKQMYVLDCNINNEIDDPYLEPIHFKFIKVSHLHTVESYGFLMTNKGKTLYYSGDANELPCEVIKLLNDNKIDFIYQDTCGIDYDGNAHLSLDKLSKRIPLSKRNQVYCIHHDKHLDYNKVTELQFKIPILYNNQE